MGKCGISDDGDCGMNTRVRSAFAIVMEAPMSRGRNRIERRQCAQGVLDRCHRSLGESLPSARSRPVHIDVGASVTQSWRAILHQLRNGDAVRGHQFEPWRQWRRLSCRWAGPSQATRMRRLPTACASGIPQRSAFFHP